jgi:crotonobetainyl-CoA:carnitine CoA-transferase CaiB-like acyl-CoA transferase
MRSPTKQDGTTDRRKTERRSSAASKPASGERRVVEQRGVVTSMVDALEDILKWERASERAMRVAVEHSEAEIDPSN